MTITNRQLKAARELIGWEQSALASKAGVSIGTIRRMEGARQKNTDASSGRSEVPIRGNHDTVMKVLAALEAAGVEFIPAGEYHGAGGAGVRLKGGGATEPATPWG